MAWCEWATEMYVFLLASTQNKILYDTLDTVPHAITCRRCRALRSEQYIDVSNINPSLPMRPPHMYCRHHRHPAMPPLRVSPPPPRTSAPFRLPPA